MRKTARGLALLLALWMTAALVACGEKAPAEAAPGKSLCQQGQEVVALMTEMAGSDTYAGLFSTDPEMLAVLADAGKGDFSTPRTVYRIQMPPEALLKVADTMGILEAGDLSDNLQAVVNSRVLSALPTQINAMGGSTVLAASSICSAGKTFVSPELTRDQIYLYLYDNAVPAAVVFTKGEDGAVSATGTLLLNDSFGGYRLEELRGVLEGMGAEIAEVPLS